MLKQSKKIKSSYDTLSFQNVNLYVYVLKYAGICKVEMFRFIEKQRVADAKPTVCSHHK